jgi:hypothetical protein
MVGPVDGLVADTVEVPVEADIGSERPPARPVRSVLVELAGGEEVAKGLDDAHGIKYAVH